MSKDMKEKYLDITYQDTTPIIRIQTRVFLDISLQLKKTTFTICLDNKLGEKRKEGKEKKKYYFASKSFLLWRDLNVNKLMGLNPSKSSSFLFAIQIRESSSFQILSFLFPPFSSIQTRP